MYTIRPAVRSDDRAIRALIYQVRINPMGLDWRHFLIAIDENGRLVGCGQIKPHADGTRELASIAVQPERRGQGIARAIIERLLAENPRPLYLTCQAHLGSLYAKFGFRKLAAQEMSPYFRRIWRITQVIKKIAPRLGELWVMKLD